MVQEAGFPQLSLSTLPCSKCAGHHSLELAGSPVAVPWRAAAGAIAAKAEFGLPRGPLCLTLPQHQHCLGLQDGVAGGPAAVLEAGVKV